MNTIINFISDLTYDHIPAGAIASARRCLIDAVGCMAAGIQYSPIRDLARKVCRSSPGDAGIIGTGLTTARAWAAFINTHACTFFDLDDGHRKAQGHPGGVIIPLALMTAARREASGKELLTAIVAGYETAVRSALIMRQAGGPRKGSGAWSITGAAAAAAKLNRLPKTAIKNALGLAEYYAPQAPQDRSLAGPSSMKEGMAWAAFSAQAVIDLATAGFDAMTPFLSDADTCRDLGSTWEIESVYHKMYACCRFSHPVLDGISDLMRTHGISAAAIGSIRVKSFEKALLLSRTRPENPIAAMYSIPYTVGCKLVKGRVGPQEMSGGGLTDPAVLGVADKVIIEEDPGITAVFPEKCLARLEIHLTDGSVVKTRTLSAKGDPDHPYPDTQMHEKFTTLAASLAGSEPGRLYDCLVHIEDMSVAEI